MNSNIVYGPDDPFKGHSVLKDFYILGGALSGNPLRVSHGQTCLYVDYTGLYYNFYELEVGPFCGCSHYSELYFLACISGPLFFEKYHMGSVSKGCKQF